MPDDTTQMTHGIAEQYFADAAATGTLKVPTCRSCQKAHWYPRRYCPFCLSDDLDLLSVADGAKVYSFSIVRRATEPYVLAYVQLAEGPILLTNIVESKLSDLEIGMHVAPTTFNSGATLIPAFRVRKND